MPGRIDIPLASIHKVRKVHTRTRGLRRFLNTPKTGRCRHGMLFPGGQTGSLVSRHVLLDEHGLNGGTLECHFHTHCIAAWRGNGVAGE